MKVLLGVFLCFFITTNGYSGEIPKSWMMKECAKPDFSSQICIDQEEQAYMFLQQDKYSPKSEDYFICKLTETKSYVALLVCLDKRINKKKCD